MRQWMFLVTLLVFGAFSSTQAQSIQRAGLCEAAPQCIQFAQRKPWCDNCWGRCGTEATRCVQQCGRSSNSGERQRCTDNCFSISRACRSQCDREC